MHARRSGSNVITENETMSKFEIMDGAPVRGWPVPPHIDTISPACRCWVLVSLSVVSVLVGRALSLRIPSAHSYWLKAKASCDVINRRRVYPGPSLPLQFPACPNSTRRVQQVQCPVGGA